MRKDYYGEKQINTDRKEFDKRTQESRGGKRNSSEYDEQIKNTRTATKNDELSFYNQRQDNSNIKSNFEIIRDSQKELDIIIFL